MLNEIKGTVSKFADAIANVLDIDVIITDNEAIIIGNTVKYMSKDVIHVSGDSIMGEVLRTGKPIVVKDKNDFENCKMCPELDVCQMQGVIGVPIFYEGKVLGSIGLIFAEEMIESNVFKQLDNTINFLENMAELLGSKLQNLADFNKVKLIQTQRETIMDAIDVGLVYIDNDGIIEYYNHTFASYFEHLGKVENQDIQVLFNNKMINQFILDKNAFKNRVFYYERNDYVFDGLLSCANITVDGEYYGAIVTFESIIDINSAVNELSFNKSFVQFNDILGSDRKIQDAIEQGKKLSLTDKNILIDGEVGVGKSILGRAIHNYSDRKDNYFITVNCNNTSSELLGMELFGLNHETNKISGIGKLRLADHGTLYFDEIGQMPLTTQEKLNVVLKDNILSYYGSNKGIPVNVRMIFSTSEDLEKRVKQGRFNEELYYRIMQNKIALPSIREHKSDLKYMMDHYLDKYKRIHKKEGFKIDQDVLERMMTYEWFGNNVELEHTLEEMVINIKSNTASVLDVNNYNFANAVKVKEIQTIDMIEKELIVRLMNEKMDKDTIAKELGISRATLYRKLKRYDIN